MRTLFLTTLWLWVAVSRLAAQNPAYSYPEVDPNGERFLFIVDMSSDMEDLQPALESALYELIGGGIFGQMRTGDTFGLWTFNEETYSGKFSMKIWDQKRAIQQGTVASAFISGQSYEKSSNLKDVIKQLKTVIHSVSNLNVLILSDGRSSMSGTPLDKAINADYKSKKSDRRRAKKPFITGLVARDGWIVSHQVVVAGDPVRFPERRPPPAPPRPAAAVVLPVNSPPPASIIVTAASVAKKIVIATKTNAPVASVPVVLPPAAGATNALPPSPETNAAAIVSPVVLPPTPPASAAVAPTKPVPPIESSVVASQASILAALRESNRTATAPQPAPTTAATPVPSSVIEGVLAKVQPEPVRVAAREPGVAGNPMGEERREISPALGQVMPGVRSTFGNWWMAAGGFLAGATVLLAFSVMRRGKSAPGPSLITRSMDRR